MKAPNVVARIGRKSVLAVTYSERDWVERDNFDNLDTARGYAEFKSRQYPLTPYRIVLRRGRYVVQYVPEWLLRTVGPAEAALIAERTQPGDTCSHAVNSDCPHYS